MAIAYIREYARLVGDADGNPMQVGHEDGNRTNQKVTFTAGATASAAFQSDTKFIRVYTDTAGYMEFGAAPTATTADDIPIAATTPEYFGVVGGQKVSIVA